VCSTPFTGAEAVVTFAILGLPKAAASIEFGAGNHLFSGRYSSASISVHEEKNFNIRKSENTDSRYAVSWSLKTRHLPPNPTQLTASPSSTQTPTTPALPPEPERALGIPHNSLLNSATSTQLNPAEAPQSSNASLAQTSPWQIQFNVTNDTESAWNLDEKGLDAGDWAREPPMTLKPFSQNSWLSLPSFAGVMGYAKFRCSGASQIIFFAKWSAQVVSTPQIEAVVAGPQPRSLDLEYRVSHTSDCIIVDVTLFSEGSLRNKRLAKSSASAQLSSSPGSQSSVGTNSQRSRVQNTNNDDGLMRDMSSPNLNLTRVSPMVSGASSVSLNVFRMPIEVLVEREARGSQVPWLVEILSEWLVTEHISNRGLFSQGGRYNEIKTIKSLVESGEAQKMVEKEGLAFWKRFAPASVVSVLKIFLRELPVPLVPTSLVPHLMTIEGTESASAYTTPGVSPLVVDHAELGASLASSTHASRTRHRNSAPTQAVAHFLKELPFTQRATLILLTKALRALWVAPNSSHTLDSLAIVFGPLIAPDKPDGSLKSALPVISAYSTLIECIDDI
jgi:hypothetical protein